MPLVPDFFAAVRPFLNQFMDLISCPFPRADDFNLFEEQILKQLQTHPDSFIRASEFTRLCYSLSRVADKLSVHHFSPSWLCWYQRPAVLDNEPFLRWRKYRDILPIDPPIPNPST
ncbi:hypothetical protein BDN70DRAFT_901274 [Pholiota conissans]|uniref:Uncharacterized protein n=1 Tax=Pholiota conissans TaxID=109636 RepID=A0A9P5YLU9_9AGAR|nr:hypothetical protein BDN70DRAFT_901274 [Pholiota conissans]